MGAPYATRPRRLRKDGTRRAGHRSLTLAVAAFMAAGLAGARTLTAQIPEEFTNLQVLPEDISRGELAGVMRSFAMGLGLRCSSCHVGREGEPLSTYDFASDDKSLKVKARAMMRMVKDINEGHLAELPRRRRPGIEVTCSTCHGGIRRPEPIQSVVTRVLEEEGITEAVDRYRSLRERYYGTRAYDFGERPLLDVAGRVARGGDAASAQALLQVNLEYYPDSWQTMSQMGAVLDRAGDTAGAVEWYRRSLEIFENQPPVQARLRELGGGGA